MAALRATSFYAGVVSVAGWQTAYTVPAGHVIRLRNILIMMQSASSGLCGVRVSPSLNIWIPNVGAGATAQLDVSINLGAGSVLQVNCPTARVVSYFLSGYIFFV